MTINAENIRKAIEYAHEVSDPDIMKAAVDEDWALEESVPVIAQYAHYFNLDPGALGIGLRLGYLAQRFALDEATNQEEGEVVVPIPVLEDEEVPTAEDEEWWNDQRTPPYD